MIEPKVRCISPFISVGCNKTPHCIDWGSNGLICFGACNSIAICSDKQIYCTLSHHKARINAVSWIRDVNSGQSENELVSASSDNTCSIWTANESEVFDSKFSLTDILTGHTNFVTIVCGVYVNSPGSSFRRTVIASASADSTVRLWVKDKSDGNFSCTEVINLGSAICSSLVITSLQDCHDVIIAIGTDDSKVCLYSGASKLVSLDGHEDWVRTLDFTREACGDTLLASGAQDASIRIWRISKNVSSNHDDLFKQKKHVFSSEGNKFTVTVETVLFGHEGWIYGVKWKPNSGGTCLTSCSLDRTVLTWAPDANIGLWLETARLGELGGNTLGYLGIAYSPDASRIVANSWQGALHMWEQEKGDGGWRGVSCCGGHSDGVEDISWERSLGMYLLSCSLDQSTRLFTPAKSDGNWFELSRPQIHGHAMSGITTLPQFDFVSCSEEKVIRVFSMPRNVFQNLTRLASFSADNGSSEMIGPLGACVPSLGLSNKAVFNIEQTSHSSKHPKDEFSDGYFTPQYLEEAPTEEILAQNTLWPERMKLYGHGYEVFTVASSWKGDLVASACKASTAQHAKLFLWDTDCWDKLDELVGHTLTVTQIEFSPDDSAILSVSRDRTWCLFRKKDDGGYSLTCRSTKQFNPHSRIIWSCCWTADGNYFATSSRDGRVCVWPAQCDNSPSHHSPVSDPLVLEESVTAIALPRKSSFDRTLLIAVGLEYGEIQLWSYDFSEFNLLYVIPKHLGHHLTVRRLAFKPGLVGRNSSTDHNCLVLASCGSDHSVRIFTLDISF